MDAAEHRVPETSTIAVGGRTISYCELGAPDGVPVIVAHGSPGSRFQLLPLDARAAEAGIRLIAPDRPGYGGTSPEADRGFETGLADAVALLDALGIDRAVALGFSGGADYALTLAQAQPERIERVVIVCGMHGRPPRAALKGRLPMVSTAFRLSHWAPRLAVALFGAQRKPRDPDARPVAEREPKPGSMPEADRLIVIDPALKPLLAADAEAGIAQGAGAAIEDLGRYGRLDMPRDVHRPVRLLHGTEDGNVPIAVARWAAAELPDAELTEFEGQGHLFAVTRPDAVLDAILGR
ncbi:alpha/beta hydrolase [Microbacterium sp.]|uniref:alpha/beta fold hydrolase n=1 Tax=Microbacterium sp. TaxID=51671 RepID=UPI00333FDDFF